MKNIFKIATLLISFNSIASCSVLDNLGQKNGKQLAPLDFLEKSEKLNVKDFLNGELEGFAIVKDENGKITKSFVIDVDGKWEEKKGTVRYNYKFNDGKKDSRTWLITVDDSENYTAIGHDFTSPAKGRQAGNVSQIIYTLLYPYEDKKENINFEDNMYLVNKNSMIVISKMRLRNKEIGTATISLKKIQAKKMVVDIKSTTN